MTYDSLLFIQWPFPSQHFVSPSPPISQSRFPKSASKDSNCVAFFDLHSGQVFFCLNWHRKVIATRGFCCTSYGPKSARTSPLDGIAVTLDQKQYCPIRLPKRNSGFDCVTKCSTVGFGFSSGCLKFAYIRCATLKCPEFQDPTPPKPH